MHLRDLCALCGHKSSTLRPQSLRELRVKRLLGTEVAEDFGLVAPRGPRWDERFFRLGHP